MRTHVDLDQNFERCPRRANGRCQREHICMIVDQHADRGGAGKRCEPLDLVAPDDFIGDEDVGYACRNKDFGFADLLATHPDGAGGDLPLGDFRALVALCVRPQARTAITDRRRHRRDVAFECVKVDDQRRRTDVVERSAGPWNSRRQNAGRRNHAAFHQARPVAGSAGSAICGESTTHGDCRKQRHSPGRFIAVVSSR